MTTAPSFQHGIPDASWDVGLQGLDGHFLQGNAWCHFSSALGQPTYTARDSEWMWSAHVRSAGPFTYLYAPYGPTAKTPAGLLQAIDSLRTAAKELHCDFVRVEPLDMPQSLPPSTRKVRSRQPDATWRLRIDTDEAILRKGLTKGHKGSINAAPRKGISIVRDDSAIGDFLTLLHKTEQQAAIASHDDDYFRTMLAALPAGSNSLYFADVEGERVATAMVFVFGATTYYAYAGADRNARSLSPAAPLVWQIILDAQARAGIWFDFWGVTTSTDPEHPWAGFSQFKRSFGGELLERAGTFDIVLRGARYTAYRVAQRVM